MEESTMKKQCAWCRKSMGSVKVKKTNIRNVTHGICDGCAYKLFAELDTTIYDFLDTIDAPIAIIEDNATVWGANKSARAMLGKDHSQIHGNLGGVVFECKYSYQPGGCGKTEHCSGCKIRNTVMDTLKTGNSAKMIPVVLKQKTKDGEQDVPLYISTEKINNVVVMKIDTKKCA